MAITTSQQDTTRTVDWKKVGELLKLGKKRFSLNINHSIRHQLRLHLAITGHAILGDSTYEKSSQNRMESCNRMCLHARQLTIPLIEEEIKTFEAPDPFYLKEGCMTFDNE